MNINNCHKLSQQTTEGTQTAKVRLFYRVAVPVPSHTAQGLPSHSVYVHTLTCL